MQGGYEKAFNTLGDPTRRAVSQHLKVLVDAGLIEGYRNGARNIYRIDTRRIQAMREYLDRFWDTALVAFKAAAHVVFEVFTQKIDLWWPRSHHIGKTPTTHRLS